MPSSSRGGPTHRFSPFPAAALRAADSLDAGFFSAIRMACRTTTSGRRRSALSILRALVRLPSPFLRRHTPVHRVARRLKTRLAVQDLQATARAQIQSAQDALLLIPGFRSLVPEPWHPWSCEDEMQAAQAEWHSTNIHSSRPVPPPGSGTAALYHPVLWLRAPWARNLAARYHCGTFYIFNRTAVCA